MGLGYVGAVAHVLLQRLALLQLLLLLLLLLLQLQLAFLLQGLALVLELQALALVLLAQLPPGADPLHHGARVPLHQLLKGPQQLLDHVRVPPLPLQAALEELLQGSQGVAGG